jgi:hypothetical protein
VYDFAAHARTVNVPPAPPDPAAFRASYFSLFPVVEDFILATLNSALVLCPRIDLKPGGEIAICMKAMLAIGIIRTRPVPQILT